MSELKNCPWCDVRPSYAQYGGSSSIFCSNPSCAVFPSVECKTLELAKTAWNTRAGEAAVRDAALEEAALAMKHDKHGRYLRTNPRSQIKEGITCSKQ